MKIEKQIIEQLIAHAKKEAPLEACGYLAGRDHVITVSYELTNQDQSSEHFSFDPKEQFSAVKDARQKGFEIYAVYHSHPASPARPSAEDIKLAYDPDILYFIVSLASGREDVRAFEIKNKQVESVNLEVIHHEGV
ncbi:MAG: hypothetical protein A3G33_04300 [Omnitrophica bacterium RIFCSPLOWO2_12_FULL_44_17]|uniref:MPN domain-containing protein n=1 Tax=Candidatus Danuiimicrobium aquiferis TaxID=1801832 RepID=A0A1G1KQG3_9BACT|nr:MAG: hypothetical protein A3B72_10510 [Omnitrophica bacterium RIFCSPHIGHO2_02_FULL_45_28]OGW95157.1 MAG: hypothetical protein A3G33_04300 [Omnitrophica bacterium RIFCSPLOWO2_12_FULL_44_17]OGX01698.1 MAG: hypothetical protein A3J12_04135 [Omnitrophica bacterium RIFCSPLOWO2_02_FULL_44_11]